MFDGQTAYNDVHREYTDEKRAGPVVQRAAYRQLAAKLGDLGFLGFFALYTIAAIIWLLVGLLPFVAGEFPSLRATLRQWANITAGTTWIRRLALNVSIGLYPYQPPAQVILQYLFSLLNLVLGVYLIWLRPRNRAARLLSLGMIGTAAIFNLQAHNASEILPALEALHSPFHLIAGLAYIPALLLFPDGRLVPRMSRSRWFIRPLRVLGLLLLAFLGFAAANFTDGEPEGLVMFFGVVIPIAGVSSQAVRYRYARSAEERQQSRVLMWALILAFGLALLFAALLWGLNALRPGISAFQFLELRQLVFLVFPSLFAVIPLTLFAVIVHYRLWDIDILINRTLVYGTLTAGVTLVYAGGIVLLQQLFGTLTAQQSTVAIVASTLLIAALFQPLRRRLQTFVDRRFYREQVNFRRAFTDFAREIRTLIDLRDLVHALVDRTTELLHIAHSAVFLRGPDGTFPLAEARNLPAHEATELDLDSDLLLQMQTGSVISRPEHVTFPLLVPMLAPQGGGSELIGVLALGPRLSRQRYGRDEQALLAGLADQAGTAIHVAHLIEEQRVEAQRREESERRLEEHRRSPTGRAEAAARAILARPEAALSELHRLTGVAGHDRDTAVLLGNLPTALANLGAESIAELAKGFSYLFTSQFAPELLPAGLRSITTQLEQVAFTPQPSIQSDGSAAPEAEPSGWAAAALVVYRLCQAALEAPSIAEIIELLPPLHGREPFIGPLFCSAAPVHTADRNGQEQTLVDLARYLAELQSVSDQLYTAELVDTSQDKLTYLASAVERLSRIDRRAQAELGSADRPIIQRIIENWLGIVTRAMSELQTRAHIVANLLTRHTWQTEVITLVLNVRNVGRGAARNLHVKVTAAPEYTVLDGNGALARLAPNEEAQVELRVQPRLQREANGFRAHFVVRYADSRGEGQVAHFADDIHLLRADEPFKFIPNPYVVGTPLKSGSPLFVGREDLMAFVRENLHAAHRNNLVLIGQRRTGKTSLLKQLPARLGDAYVPVYLDGQTLGLDPGLPSFFHALATEIALALQERGFSVELPDLSDFAEGPAHVFEHQFLRRVREAIAERHVVILLDEFEEVEAAVRGGNLPPAVFGFLRHLIQHTDNLSTIFCGTHRLEELAADYWNVLFNISLYRHVGFLERPEALRLVQEPVAAYGMRYDDLALEKIWRVTSGHPYFLQLLCHSLVNRHNKTERNSVTIGDVNAALEEILRAGEAHFVYLWTESSRAERLALVSLSRIMPLGGQASAGQVMEYLVEQNVPVERPLMDEALQRLVLRDILLATNDGKDLPGGVYRWKLGLVGLWAEAYRSLSRVVDEMGR